MKKYLNPFILTVSALLLVVYLYISLRLAGSIGHWALLSVPFLLIWSIPAIHWMADKERFSRLEVAFQQASYIAAGWVSWMLVFTLLRDLLLLLSLLIPARDGPAAILSHWDLAFTSALAALATFFGIWNALRGPVLREVTIPMTGLPESLAGIRIAQVSDLHVGPTLGLRYVRKVVSVIERAQPDFTVLTGDLVDGTVPDLSESLEPLARLASQSRVFYVPGNHEYYWSFQEWTKEFSRMGATVLLNRGTQFEHQGSLIGIGGVSDPVAPEHQGAAPDVFQAAATLQECSLRILLSHRPHLAAEASRAGFQLQLSGHTHGGQFFPWTLVARRFHQYFLGLMKHDQMWIYVSPGTGTWGPPLRVGTTPEVSLLRLVRAEAKPDIAQI